MSNSDPLDRSTDNSSVIRTSDLRWLGMEESNGEGESDTRMLSTFLHGLRRRWLMILLLGVPLAVGAAAATWYLTETEYVARAVLLFRPPDNLIGAPNDRDSESVLEDHETQLQLITGPDVLQAALDRKVVAEATAGLDLLKDEFERVNWLEERTSAQFPGGSNVMHLTVRCTDKEAAKALANAIVDVYQTDIVQAESQARQQRLNDLQQAAEAMEQQIREGRELLATLDPNGDSDGRLLSVAEQTILARYTSKLQQLTEVQSQIRDLRARREIGDESSQAAPDGIEVTETEFEFALIRDNRSQEIERSIARVQSQIDDAPSRLREPQLSEYVSDYEAKIGVLEAQLAERAAEVRQELSLQKKLQREMRLAGNSGSNVVVTDIESLEQHAKELTEELDAIRAEANSIDRGQSTVEVRFAEAEIASAEELLRQINREASVLRLIVDNTIEDVTPLGKAGITPGEAEKRRIMKCGGMGFLTLLLWSAAVVGLDFRRQRVSDPTDVSVGLQLKVLGIVPLMKRSRRRNMQHSERFAEAVDGISAELLCGTMGSEHRVVMISSAMAGEGKTTLAANLASSLANAGQEVLLVDFDLRRPMLHRVFDVEVEPGVSELLNGECELSDAIHDLDDSPARLMTAGRWRQKTLSHLTDASIERLFNSVRESYDFVVVDASPILPAIDTRIVARHVDGVVLSMLRDVSERPKVKAACDVLNSFGARVLGAVVIGASADLYYGYSASESRRRA